MNLGHFRREKERERARERKKPISKKTDCKMNVLGCNLSVQF